MMYMQLPLELDDPVDDEHVHQLPLPSQLASEMARHELLEAHASPAALRVLYSCRPL